MISADSQIKRVKRVNLFWKRINRVNISYQTSVTSHSWVVHWGWVFFFANHSDSCCIAVGPPSGSIYLILWWINVWIGWRSMPGREGFGGQVCIFGPGPDCDMLLGWTETSFLGGQSSSSHRSHPQAVTLGTGGLHRDLSTGRAKLDGSDNLKQSEVIQTPTTKIQRRLWSNKDRSSDRESLSGTILRCWVHQHLDHWEQRCDFRDMHRF